MNCWPGSMDYGKREAGDVRLGVCGPPGGWEVGGLAHLILLGELEAVVGLESFRVFCHVPNGDGRVAEHACGESRPAHMASHLRGPGRGGEGAGGALRSESAMDELRVRGGGGEEEGLGWAPWGRGTQAWRRSTRWSLPHPPQAPGQPAGGGRCWGRVAPQDFKLLVPRGKKQASDTEMKKQMWLAEPSGISSPW